MLYMTEFVKKSKINISINGIDIINYGYVYNINGNEFFYKDENLKKGI